MKKLKLFPKTFLYTLGLMLFIILIAHGLFYFLTPRMVLNMELKPQSGVIAYEASFNVLPFVTQAIRRVLPISLAVSFLISAACSLWFSKKLTKPIKHISAVTEQMAQMDKAATCCISSRDEISALAVNVNNLYQTLLTVIQDLENEKQRLADSEKSRVDFMRAASHELKTPVTALNAMLENMILGVAKYRDFDTYLPECKQLTSRLSDMIHEILETTKAGTLVENETPVNTELAGFINRLCQPYMLIAEAHGIHFVLDLSGSFCRLLPPELFGKAVSNILANAVNYTPKGQTIYVYFEKNKLVIENECNPLTEESLRHLFEPFYRPDYARNRDQGGNGLGLYIVATLFKAMDITYEFEPVEHPQGMRFTIYM